MMNHDPRPLSTRKKVQLMVALTILAWATQTLLHQWGFGADVAAQPEPRPARSEKFVPGTARFAAGATLEMRTEATVLGAEVKLKQVCRWSGADDAVFAPLADLVLARFDESQPFRPVTIEQVRRTLHDAGVNLAVVRFSGPTSCTVARSDAEYNEEDALLEWASAKQGKTGAVPATTAAGRSTPTGAPMLAADKATDPTGGAEDVAADQTLRGLLVRDLAVRFRLAPDDLHVTFNPKDDQALRLSEPQFKFDVQPRRVRNLGPVSWDVQILTGGRGAPARKSQKMTIAATARVWQRQVVVAKPLAFRQTIRDTDVTERRILVDVLDDEPLLDLKQVVAQQAARELKPGAVMTAKLVQPVPLARTGQFVTVLLDRGGVRIKTVARAMEEGSYGQTIKVKNEATKDVYEVVLTGPQEATMGPAPDSVPMVEAAEASAR
jgi:flagella basal body P-ring formation protein FlgA